MNRAYSFVALAALGMIAAGPVQAATGLALRAPAVAEPTSPIDVFLDLTTDRHGRPYTLVCTKNQASYDRRAKQRKQDLEDLARLDG